MSLNLSIDFNQLQFLIGQCSLEEKIELSRNLERETFPVRFNQILDRIKTDELTFEEITDEVKKVRQKRYVKEFDLLDEILEDHGLAKLMDETIDDEELSFQGATFYYNSLTCGK
jgi:hypothetical protein